MSTTIVEVKKPGLKTSIAIQPYVSDTPNMGLENYGMVIHDGVYQVESLGSIDANGVKRYLTGLNEFAPEVMALDEKARKAKQAQIRKDVVFLEKALAQNEIKETDEDFWNKVQVVKSNNSEFWDKQEIRLHNGSIYLDAENNPFDLIKLRAIEAGGYSLVAPSYEVAKKRGNCKWYLDRFEKTVSDKTVELKIRNTAIAKLTDLFEKDVQKLRYVLKNILHDGVNIVNGTPNDVLYEEADSYINGKGQEKVIRKAAKNFSETSEMKLEDLKLRAIVRDASAHNFLITKSDGKIYHARSAEMLGGNLEECVEKLKHPLNEKLLLDIQNAVEAEWKK